MRRLETNAPQAGVREVAVEKWVYGGRGLARAEGQVVLVPFVLPGERVRVSAERERRGMVEAELEEVVTASPERVVPRCPYFSRCGGCHYQHASYPEQLQRKVEVLREVFRRVGKLAAPEEIEVVAGEPFGYRNRVQLHFDQGRIGFLEAGSHRLCAVEECAVASPGINRALEALRSMRRDRRFPDFLRTLELFTNESEVQINVLSSSRPVARRFFEWCAEQLPGADKPHLEYAAAGERFRVSRNSFFQVNRFLADRLVEAALGDAEGGSALDLYAGVGLFTLPLARRFEKVTAVESAAGAARDLAFNAERAGLPVEVVQRSAAEALVGLDRAPELVMADPPRTGMGPELVRELLRLKPPVLVVVSCDPATLARDLAALAGGGYRVEKLMMVDLFPQTYHIESVVRLRG